MMGGSIDVKSELGKGTVFTLILIQKKTDENYYRQKSEKTDAADMKISLCGKHILLAEDNELNAVLQYLKKRNLSLTGWKMAYSVWTG